jgi:squalene synthase HpnC/squalene synthase HpnD
MPYSFAAHLERFGPSAVFPPMDLARARSYCALVTRTHYENFTVASALLPRRLVPHFYPVYAYCRWADDLGDETGGGQTALDLLSWWRGELLDCYEGRQRHPVMIALKPTIDRFRIPPKPFLDLLKAFEQDQAVKEYSGFNELLQYCENSANPVGRLVLYLSGCFDERRAALSDSICTGLQLANFWQDVRRDYIDLGRVYLPEQDRLEFGYPFEDLKACRYSREFAELMRFEVDRARGFLERGRPLLGMLPADIRVDIELFLEGGLAILRKIERVDYDVLTIRPKVSKRDKATLLLKAVGRKLGAGSDPRVSSRMSVSCRQATANGTMVLSSLGSRQEAHDVPHARRHPEFDSYAENNSSPGRLQQGPTVSYAWCHRLTRRTAKNFYYSFQVLPRQQRRAMDALYAFMRVTDDLADEPGEVEAKRTALKKWRESLAAALNGVYSHSLHAALHDATIRFAIPSAYLTAVIDGVEMDLEPIRFQTFEDLYAYCYRVASAVGLACIHVWGFRDELAKQYAEAAGIAFQLTNILRDLGEDLSRGRVYLPTEDIERFRTAPETWRQRGQAFEKMMRFQAERALSYYRRGERLIPLLTPSGRAVFQVMTRIYQGLLEEIEARRYDVFRERVRLSPWRKLRSLLMAFPGWGGWL